MKRRKKEELAAAQERLMNTKIDETYRQLIKQLRSDPFSTPMFEHVAKTPNNTCEMCVESNLLR